jgi:polyhydroxyalkanoate synthase
MAGSWWPDWHRWVTGFGKAQVPARTPGDHTLKAIEDAPGSYVRIRAIV